MKSLIIKVILLVVCSIIIGYFLSKIVGSIPMVYWSVSKDKCVKIVVFDINKKEWIEKNCSDMPKKYEKVWVE